MQVKHCLSSRFRQASHNLKGTFIHFWATEANAWWNHLKSIDFIKLPFFICKLIEISSKLGWNQVELLILFREVKGIGVVLY